LTTDWQRDMLGVEEDPTGNWRLLLEQLVRWAIAAAQRYCRSSWQRCPKALGPAQISGHGRRVGCERPGQTYPVLDRANSRADPPRPPATQNRTEDLSIISALVFASHTAFELPLCGRFGIMAAPTVCPQTVIVAWWRQIALLTSGRARIGRLCTTPKTSVTATGHKEASIWRAWGTAAGWAYHRHNRWLCVSGTDWAEQEQPR
jgi:hypothetical protein